MNIRELKEQIDAYLQSGGSESDSVLVKCISCSGKSDPQHITLNSYEICRCARNVEEHLLRPSSHFTTLQYLSLDVSDD